MIFKLQNGSTLKQQLDDNLISQLFTHLFTIYLPTIHIAPIQGIYSEALSTLVYTMSNVTH